MFYFVRDHDYESRSLRKRIKQINNPVYILVSREPISKRISPLAYIYHAVDMLYAVLALISQCYPPLKGRLLTCYSPVRH